MSHEEETVPDESETRDEESKENREVKDVKVKLQLEKKTISPLTLLRDDLSQFKDEVLKVLKDTRAEHEARPSNQTGNKVSSSTLSLLRDDLSQFKEDVSSIFGVNSSKDKDVKSADPKSSQAAERSINPLSLIKEDISNVFRLALSKDKDNRDLKAQEDKIKVLRAERTEDPFMRLFRRDQTLRSCERAEDGQEDKKTTSEKNEKQTDDGFTGQLSDSEDKINTMEDQSEESDVDDESEGKPTTRQTEETRSQTADQRCDHDSVDSEEDENKEEKGSETLHWENLISELSLISLREDKDDDRRDEPGEELWSVKNFAIYLTMDPSTANSELLLSDHNRKATRVWSDNRYLENMDRFECCPQVLCREALLESVYWEVEWSGGADIGVTYNSISRDGDTASCLLGHNESSWSLECSEDRYTPCYNNKRFKSSSPDPFTRRVGVYLDWSAGSLSFYCISQDAMVHLHTFTSTFTQPLYPGFWVWAYDGSVSLCQVELNWERLLQ
ncbi:neoverrucotoxin subunit alpha-like isoform X1 [Hippoglossus hippoglossus]|uniref:neoverrucotoxin subunit alpha-like isoform X1 n=1 Tax=Hippoglossus hippoglossus TaxID=8267 RepID=UPI00148B5170|nr:neoverrucotoxin subunit alpha-like isoform X1 [Hippoglossus hippoglossus]XP_035032140.1 neoverrucotoxin subunit alpha isoform X2 [Hippoglossus stenolepis]